MFYLFIIECWQKTLFWHIFGRYEKDSSIQTAKPTIPWPSMGQQHICTRNWWELVRSPLLVFFCQLSQKQTLKIVQTQSCQWFNQILKMAIEHWSARLIRANRPSFASSTAGGLRGNFQGLWWHLGPGCSSGQGQTRISVPVFFWFKTFNIIQH